MRRAILGVVVAVATACGGSSRPEGGGGSGDAGAGARGGADTAGRSTGDAGEERFAGEAESTGGKPSDVCVPNETQLCYGPGACRGAQPCRADGSGWEPCDCGGSVAEQGGSAGDDVPSSAGRATGGVRAGGNGQGGSGGTHTGGSAGGDGAGSGGLPCNGACGGSGGTGGGVAGTGGTNGGASSATGGVSYTGGTAVTGGTTSVGGSAYGPFVVKAGGYVSSGRIHGYAWTAGDDVFPEDFSTLAAGGDLCVSGIAPATPDYSGVGILGIDLNQSSAGSAEADDFLPTGSGIKIRVTNAGGSELRLQIHGTNDYCTALPPGGGSFDWSEFKTSCWDTGGVAYDPSRRITAIMVEAPGEGPDGLDVAYEFCVTDLEEVP
jgi:hypothetical protein